MKADSRNMVQQYLNSLFIYNFVSRTEQLEGGVLKSCNAFNLNLCIQRQCSNLVCGTSRCRSLEVCNTKLLTFHIKTLYEYSRKNKDDTYKNKDELFNYQHENHTHAMLLIGYYQPLIFASMKRADKVLLVNVQEQRDRQHACPLVLLDIFRHTDPLHYCLTSLFQLKYLGVWL